MYKPNPHEIPAADGIRGLACLLVLVVHSVQLVIPSSSPYLAGCGKIGVWLFFCLSAYLLTNQLRRSGLSRDSLKVYAVSRFLRVYPPFVITVLAAYQMKAIGLQSRQDIVSALLLEQGYGHLWTIPVEVKFYFALPIFVWVASWFHHRFMLAGVLLVAALCIGLHQIFFPYGLVADNSIETVWYLPAFVIGTVGAYVGYGIASVRWARWLGAPAGLLILVLILLSTPIARALMFDEAPPQDIANKFIFYAAAWTVFIVTQTKCRSWLSDVLSSRVFRELGACSYSTYLAHFLIIPVIAERISGAPVAVLVAIATSISGGYLLYLTIERPLLSLRSLCAAFLEPRIVRS